MTPPLILTDQLTVSLAGGGADYPTQIVTTSYGSAQLNDWKWDAIPIKVTLFLKK